MGRPPAPDASLDVLGGGGGKLGDLRGSDSSNRKSALGDTPTEAITAQLSPQTVQHPFEGADSQDPGNDQRQRREDEQSHALDDLSPCLASPSQSHPRMS